MRRQAGGVHPNLAVSSCGVGRLAGDGGVIHEPVGTRYPQTGQDSLGNKVRTHKERPSLLHATR